MTEPRTLLFPLGDGGDEEHRLAGALEAARTLNAHLRVMHSTLEPNALLPRDIAVPAAVLATLDQALEQHASRDNSRLGALFAEACKARGIELLEGTPEGDGVSASWFEARGVRSALVAHHGKLADWVVASQPPDGRATASLQAAVMESGRPVLMLPRRLDAVSLDTVMVAWNASPQAARALAASLGLLRRAGRVLVATVAGEGSRVPSASEMVGYLAGHGIAAGAVDAGGGGPAAGAALLELAARDGVSLLVMGAYSSHKVRDLMLGSVTAHMLAHCPVPVLMAH